MISAALRRAIKKCEVSQYALAKQAGVAQSVISRFMYGGTLSLATADKISKILGVKLQ